jgi:hypothetical protein
MKKALAITTLGEATIIDLNEGSLEKLQKAVGGYVQAIDLCEGLTMWCNEEGKMMSLPHNPFGQAFWETAFPVSEFGRTDYIVGDIVLTGGADNEGDTLGLTSDEIEALLETVNYVTNIISPRISVL